MTRVSTKYVAIVSVLIIAAVVLMAMTNQNTHTSSKSVRISHTVDNCENIAQAVADRRTVNLETEAWQYVYLRSTELPENEACVAEYKITRTSLTTGTFIEVYQIQNLYTGEVIARITPFDASDKFNDWAHENWLKDVLPEYQQTSIEIFGSAFVTDTLITE